MTLLRLWKMLTKKPLQGQEQSKLFYLLDQDSAEVFQKFPTFFYIFTILCFILCFNHQLVWDRLPVLGKKKSELENFPDFWNLVLFEIEVLCWTWGTVAFWVQSWKPSLGFETYTTHKDRGRQKGVLLGTNRKTFLFVVVVLGGFSPLFLLNWLLPLGPAILQPSFYPSEF